MEKKLLLMIILTYIILHWINVDTKKFNNFLAELVPKNFKHKSKSVISAMSKDMEIFYGCLYKEIISRFAVKISW